MRRVTGKGRKAPARRRKAAPRWVAPVRRAAIVLGLAGIAAGGGAWLWQSDLAATGAASLRAALLARTARAGLSVEHVLLEGRRHTPRRAVKDAVDLARGAPILGVDIDAIHARLEALSWVRRATVLRRLPDTVAIRVVEHRPFALWQRRDRLVLVDDRGAVVTAHGLGAFRALPILVGDDAPRHAPKLFAMLKGEPRLARQVVSAVRVGKRRWNVELRNGVEVRLPETEPYRAWHRLARLDAEHRLLARDVRMIDMRLPGRLIVKPGPLGTQTIGGKGRNT